MRFLGGLLLGCRFLLCRLLGWLLRCLLGALLLGCATSLLRGFLGRLLGWLLLGGSFFRSSLGRSFLGRSLLGSGFLARFRRGWRAAFCGNFRFAHFHFFYNNHGGRFRLLFFFLFFFVFLVFERIAVGTVSVVIHLVVSSVKCFIERHVHVLLM